MIFCSKNEDYVPAWQLILEGRKTVTRRSKPTKVGAIRAVQPQRCKKSVCKIRILSCVAHSEWKKSDGYLHGDLNAEAHLEGFITWNGLCDWFVENGIEMEGTYRTEFEVVR